VIVFGFTTQKSSDRKGPVQGEEQEQQ